MKNLKKIILVTGILSIFSCEKETIKTNHVYESNDITIELIDVADSRCPDGLNCFWEGEAAVDLKITDKKESVNFTLTGIGDDETVLGHKIKLLDLLPFPKDGVNSSLEDMEVKLQVSKF